MAPATFGYWNIRGLGQSIRFILHYTGEPHVNKVYTLVKPDGSLTREEWLDEKFTLGLDFPNLPYYIDGDIKLTQSLTILRYIGNKHGLTGSNPKEQATINMLESEAFDFRYGLAFLAYDEKFDEKKAAYIEGLKPKMEALSKFLGKKDFLMGKISTADFMMYEALHCIRKLNAGSVDCHENLKNYMARFEALPKIKALMSSKEYIGSPLHAPGAKFGGNKE